MDADRSAIDSEMLDDCDMSLGMSRGASQMRRVRRDPSERRRVERVCLVGPARNQVDLVNILKNHFGVELLESESGIEYKEDHSVVFVCTDFIHCHRFKYLHSCGTLILGPAVIRLRAQQAKPLLMPRANRPLYTESMVGVRIALSGISGKQCREAVDLVHFMGGSARQTFTPTITHLITEAAKGKSYRTAISMGRHAVHLSWLQAAWALRDDPERAVTSKNFVTQFSVEPFCGLSLWFVAYAEDDLCDMQHKTIDHRGKLATSQNDATHIVVSNCPDAFVDDVSTRQHLVTGEWFWLSIQLNCCANEEIYQWKDARRYNRKRIAVSPAQSDEPVRSSRRTISRSSLDRLETSNSSAVADYSEHVFSTDDAEKLGCVVVVDKRHLVCNEMFETEENYLRALKIIVQVFQKPLEAQLRNPESGLLSKAEIALIFSRVEYLVDVHEAICNKLRSFISHWTSDRLFGKVWRDCASDLLRVYKVFINSCDEALKTLKRCDLEKPKFHAFLRAAESKPECQRNHLEELLMRPVQRLPSVILLLKRILDKTEKSNPDHHQLAKAIDAIDHVLKIANESRKQTDSYAKILQISSQIDRCPPDILSSARTLLSELHVLSLGGEDDWAKTRGKAMAIYLFNDLIEIVKDRNGGVVESPSKTKESASVSFTRQLSFSSFRRERKRFKHVNFAVLTSIRGIDIVIHREFEGIFVLSFRTNQGEDFWMVQCTQQHSANMRKFLKDLATQIYYVSGRMTLIEEVQLDEEPLNNEKWVTIRKALHYAVRRSSPSQSSSVRHPGHFRRAMSSMSIGISSTLSRFQSRSNLRSVNETVPDFHPQMSSRTVGPSSGTPSRSFKQMLSTSMFRPPRLGRRGSVLTDMNASHL